jgi:hypothetical protein
MQADFDDVRFSNTTCNINGSILPHDLDKANANNALYWVKTSLTTGINTISMRWGNSTISNANNASNVWTSYGGVWHLNENTSKDSAAHSSNGTPTGVVTLQPGAIGNAVNFTSTSRVELGADSSIDLSESDSFTIEMWTKSLTSAVDRVTYAQSQGACSWNTAMGTYDSDVVSSNIKFTWRDDRGAGRNTLDSGVAESTNWQYIAVKYDNNTLGEGKNSVIFINGTAKSNNAIIYNMRAGPATTTMIGYGCDFGTFTGAIDEFRISKNVISNDSINFTYQNIINPSFIVFEDEYEAPTVSAQPTSIYIYDTLKVLGNGILKIT